MSYFRITYSFVILASILFLSCGSSESTADKQPDYQRLKSIVKAGEFQIENQFLIPTGGGQIDLTTNPNHIRVYGDSISIHLPYFGVRTSGNPYTSEGGIKYEGLAENLTVQEQDADKRLELSFTYTAQGERVNFDIVIYGNKKAYTNVILSDRQTVSYQGYLSKIE